METEVRRGFTYSWVERAVKVDPICRWIVAIGELDSSHLAHHGCAGVDQALKSRACRILRGIQIMERAIATAGSYALHMKDVLNPKT